MTRISSFRLSILCTAVPGESAWLSEGLKVNNSHSSDDNEAVIMTDSIESSLSVEGLSKKRPLGDATYPVVNGELRLHNAQFT